MNNNEEKRVVPCISLRNIRYRREVLDYFENHGISHEWFASEFDAIYIVQNNPDLFDAISRYETDVDNDETIALGYPNFTWCSIDEFED